MEQPRDCRGAMIRARPESVNTALYVSFRRSVTREHQKPRGSSISVRAREIRVPGEREQGAGGHHGEPGAEQERARPVERRVATAIRDAPGESDEDSGRLGGPGDLPEAQGVVDQGRARAHRPGPHSLWQESLVSSRPSRVRCWCFPMGPCRDQSILAFPAATP